MARELVIEDILQKNLPVPSNCVMCCKMQHIVILVVLSLATSCAQGRSDSVFETVGSFLTYLGGTMNTVSKNFEKVLAGVKNVENYFNDAIEEDCHYKCSNGAKPKPNPYRQPTANGCGTIGYQIKHLPVKQLEYCCNNHDICYDTCNENKDQCDIDFKKCLYQICEIYVGNSKDLNLIKSCKASAKLMFVGTIALGCKPYKDAQRNACYCEAKNKKGYEQEL